MMTLNRRLTATLALIIPLACSSEEDPAPEAQSIVDVARADGRFTTLAQALEAAGLTATLEGAGPFTVFAPTDAAFSALPAGALDALLADTDALRAVLTYHVLPRRVSAAEVAGLTTATTVQGDDVTISVTDGQVRINGALVIQTDVAADNGIIHVIDAVLTPPEEEEEPGTILDVAVATPELSTLVTALQTASLAETMASPGPFTVFAPTNAAFDALPAGALDALLADPAALAKVLSYHVVEGRVDAAQVAGLASAPTLQGAAVEIRVEAGEVFINDAKVIVTDVEASNGVVHVIDAVLTPPTIVDIALQNPDFSTLVTALQAAELVDTLAGPGPFTVFAPTNAAFEAIPQADLQALLADKAALTGVLTYHVVPGDLRAAAVVEQRALTTAQGTSAIIAAGAAEARINGARIVATDIVAANGVIHVIDAVITPSTVAELASYAPELSTLVTAVGAADLGDALSAPGPFTVFAPVDAAFDALPAGTVDALLADIPALTDVLTYHVVAGAVTSDQVVGLSQATTLQGSDVAITVEGDAVKINDAQVLAVDILGTNGVIHLIDGVLLPPAP